MNDRPYRAVVCLGSWNEPTIVDSFEPDARCHLLGGDTQGDHPGHQS
jgi:hypothetical protein